MHTPLKLNTILTTSSIKLKPLLNAVVLPSPLRMLSTSRGGTIFINLPSHHHHHHHHHRYRHLNLQIVKPVKFRRMAEAEKIDTQPQPPLTAEKKAEEEKKKRVKEMPEPPEKPEAGDCCGSGCVRCVWDVYYEELEVYNQKLKEFNHSK